MNFSFPMDPRYFQSKRIIITGATGSIGKACSIWLLNQGARVVMVSREMSDLISIGQDFPSQAICIQCDLSNEQEHFDLISSALEVLGGLDVLINAAGVMYENDLTTTSPREHDYLMNLNLKAAFSLIKLCTPALKVSKGSVVNLTGTWGLRPQQGMISYCMSKSGLEMLTKCLALELAPIRVNSVAPGMVKSRFLNNNLKPDEVLAAKSNYLNRNPIHRLARVDDVVKAIVFLSCRKSSKLTGESIFIDGGMNLTNSIFTHWDRIDKMNSTVAASGASGHSLISKWVEKTIGMFKRKEEDDAVVKEMAGKSNWFTNLADAHYKITDNYNKIDGEDHVLHELKQRKDEMGQIFTVEHPKPARMITDKK